jgi:hypothetical protein
MHVSGAKAIEYSGGHLREMSRILDHEKRSRQGPDPTGCEEFGHPHHIAAVKGDTRIGPLRLLSDIESVDVTINAIGAQQAKFKLRVRSVPVEKKMSVRDLGQASGSKGISIGRDHCFGGTD